MKYRANVGISYRPAPGRPEKHVEAGELVDDLPTALAELFVADGTVEVVRSRKVD